MTPGQGRARSLWAPVARWEGDARVLALFKLTNVGLAMVWGFAVTFVFVRLLPLDEFRAFLLLVAFANFTVSADFGFSGILYARLRGFRLKGAEESGFHPRDIAMLIGFMGAVVAVGAALIAGGIWTGHIPTQHPALFMAFYLLTTTNIFALLVKRALAALDHNLFWELTDAVRRVLSLAFLFIALTGVPLLETVCIQIGLAVAGLLAGLAVIHGSTGMSLRDWAPFGGAWRPYLRDMGATMALTLSDVAAYNAPYVAIAMATRDPRPLLLFDFLFKMSRALTAVIRALVEAMLPRLTTAWHEGRRDLAARHIGHLRLLGLGCAVALGGVLILFGPHISALLFDNKAVLDRTELSLMAILFLGLSILCVSTFVHNALGRFGVLLAPSFLFLAGSVVSVPLGLFLVRQMGDAFGTAFLILYTLTHIAAAVWHLGKLRALVRS